jgi:hypothetical protein
MRDEAVVPPEYLDRGPEGVAEYIRYLQSWNIGLKAKVSYLLERAAS